MTMLYLSKTRGGSDEREMAARELHLAVSNLDVLYHECVIVPLGEAMLNKELIQSRMKEAVDRNDKPVDEITSLINACEWDSLAVRLTQDREIAKSVFEGPALRHRREAVLDGINRIHAKHLQKRRGLSALVHKMVSPESRQQRSSLEQPPPYAPLGLQRLAQRSFPRAKKLTILALRSLQESIDAGGRRLDGNMLRRQTPTAVVQYSMRRSWKNCSCGAFPSLWNTSTL